MENNNDHKIENPDEAFEFLLDRVHDEKRKTEWTKAMGSTSKFISENEINSNIAPKKINLFKWSSIAACLMFLITASFWVFNATQKSISSYASNHIKNSNVNLQYDSNTRGLDVTSNDAEKEQLRQEIGKLLYDEDFNQANGVFREYEKNIRLDDIDKFFFATSLLHVENEDYFKAISLLSDIIKQKANYYEEALWYRALAFGLVENKVKMKMDLETILEESNYQKKQAKNLLKKLT